MSEKERIEKEAYQQLIHDISKAMTEQQRIEKEADEYVKRQGTHDRPDITKHDFIQGASTRLRYIEQVKQILERANDKGMFYYDSVIKEIEKL